MDLILLYVFLYVTSYEFLHSKNLENLVSFTISSFSSSSFIVIKLVIFYILQKKYDILERRERDSSKPSLSETYQMNERITNRKWESPRFVIRCCFQFLSYSSFPHLILCSFVFFTNTPFSVTRFSFRI